ncbi:MAG: c-type cytochrome [Syntrophothermus sp.]
MKKVLRIAGIVLGVFVVLIIAGLVYFNSTYPKMVPPPNIKVNATPEMIARGEYLANHVTVCMDCHSTRDWSKYSGPITPGTEGKGGDKFDETMGIPGTIYAKNITPAGIGHWTDAELARAITQGLNKDGKALFPLMPYHSYNTIEEQDLKSIIAYIRTLKPIKNEVPDHDLNFPFNFIVKTMPLDKYHPSKVNKSNSVEYGKYLVNIAGCEDCHTPSEKGERDMTKRFAGGHTFTTPDYTITVANISPDKETGIGNWTKEFFINKFRTYTDAKFKSVNLTKEEFNTFMPWTMFGGMSDEDLGAIYDYLHSVKPVKNSVQKWAKINQQFSNK